MTERERVTEALKWVLRDIRENNHYQVAYYVDVINDAIKLLKQMETTTEGQ